MRGLYVSFLIFAQVIQTNAKGRITFNKRIINGVCPHDIGLGVCFFNRGYVCKDDYDCPMGSKCCQTTCGRNLCKTVKPLDDTTVRPIQCWLQKAEGHCDRRRLRYYYNAAEGKCKKFIYQGCSGNNNRFTTKQECQKTCRVGVKKSTPRKSRIKPTPSKNRKNKTIAPKRKTDILKRKKATPKRKTTAKKRKISSVSSWKPSNRITLKRKSSSSSNRVTVRRKSSKRKTVTPKRSSTSRRKDSKIIRPNKKTPKSASKRIRVHRRPFVCDLRHDGNRCSNITLSYYYDKHTKKCHRFYYTGCLSPASIIRSRAGCYMICM